MPKRVGEKGKKKKKKTLMKLNKPGLDFLKPPLPFKAVSVLSLLRAPSRSIEEENEQDSILERKKRKCWRRKVGMEQREGSKCGNPNKEEEEENIWKEKKKKGADLKIRSK